MIGQRFLLPVFPEKAIANGKYIDLGAHEASEGIFRRSNDRFTADIEARVHQGGAARALFKGPE